MNRAVVLLLAFSSLCCPCPAEDTQTQVQAMLRRARQLSGIRSPGAPAFRLHATFSFVEGLETVQGAYTEVWNSDSQWRRETVIGESHYVEVEAADKKWLVYPEGFPSQAIKVPPLMEFLPSPSSNLSFDSITETQPGGGPAADCALSRSASDDQRIAFCFDKKSGVMVGMVYPERRPRNIVSFSCQYGTFKKFGDYFFPREMVCLEDRHQTLSANVDELSFEPASEPALYAPPPGAIELGRCHGKTLPPAFSGRDITFPHSAPSRIVWVRLWFVINDKGKLKDVRPVRPGGKGSQENALNILRQMAFKPGTCDGRPIPMSMSIDIPSIE